MLIHVSSKLIYVCSKLIYVEQAAQRAREIEEEQVDECVLYLKTGGGPGRLL
jgi:hypothetical protein